MQNSGKNVKKNHFTKVFTFFTKNITFKFKYFCYKQKNGAAMGSPIAPALAEVFLTNIENKFIINSSNLIGILLYYRFVDDIFVILPAKCRKKWLIIIFDSFYKNLRLTLEHDQNNKHNFFNVLILNNNGKLMTSWYIKPSNTSMFNPWESHGPTI